MSLELGVGAADIKHNIKEDRHQGKKEHDVYSVGGDG